MLEKNLRAELKRITDSELVVGVSKHLTTYEKKLRDIVDDLNLKSRDAREKSKKKFDKVSEQLKQTRADLEKRVLSLLNQEAKRLNKGCNDVFNYLVEITQTEENARPAAPKMASGKTAGKGTKAKKTGSKSSTSKSAHKSENKGSIEVSH